MRRGGVGGKVRHTHAGAKNDHAPLFQVALRPQRQIGFSHLGHVDGGLDPAVYAFLFQEILQRQTVHDCAEHAHVVGSVPIQPALLQLCATEEVTAANNNRHLHPIAGHAGYLPCHIRNHIGVNTYRPAAEHFTSQFQHYTLVTTGAFGEIIGHWCIYTFPLL